MYPFAIGGLGGPELLIVLAVLLLLFGATKLPDLARGGGRALRIFKAETKGLLDDDEPEPLPTARADLPADTQRPVAEHVDMIDVDRVPRDAR